MSGPPSPGHGPQPAPSRVSLLSNTVSAIGFLLVAVALLLLLTFGLFSVVSPSPNPYVDIIGYMVLPGLLVTGLALVPLGALWRLWRLRRSHTGQKGSFRLPTLDLNDHHIRKIVGLFLALTFFIMLPALGVSGYFGYHFTESSEFCGQTCHAVMEPEATAHANSPHARVTCAECHIGSGASWFVKSKLSGTRQVLAVWQNSYSRPIPPAITQLRPARETCEQCHWPAKFYGRRLRELVHYTPDEPNTRRVVRMLLKVGGADETEGRVSGIHMHMVLSSNIDYVATDDVLQEIPWVRQATADGQTRIFRSDGQPTTAPPPPGLVRRVDCMDCHNRGAHHFRSPQMAVDQYLNVGRIDSSLPFIKREAVAALTAPYADAAAAETAFAQRLTTFYQTQYPGVWAQQADTVKQAIAMLGEIYRRNFFPAMKVNWQTYPENIGHMNSPGCFRCHDGKHLDAAGTPISSDCVTCHVFLNPVEPGGAALIEGEFQHAMPLALHSKLRCNQCHNGGVLRLCRDCHGSGQWLENWGKGRFVPESMP